MAASLTRADALRLPLRDESVDLIVTSPPYFALRSYTDEGEHYDGQIGSEATPQAFLEALWAVTAECVRVLKPSGSLWVNLGDKYASSGGFNDGTGKNGPLNDAGRAGGVKRKSPPGIPTKSLMGLPWRYAIGCIDRLGLILRAEVIWSKPNGLPESVTDRVRRSHEQWFHMVKEPYYFSGLDELREPHTSVEDRRWMRATNPSNPDRNDGGVAMWRDGKEPNPLGKLPGSVWTIPTEPLRVPDHLPQHFAAFPSEWPRRIILGWSPNGVCTECGEGRAPVVEKDGESRPTTAPTSARSVSLGGGRSGGDFLAGIAATITGYACACPTPDAPTHPAVVLDPFAGTGTVPAVADALGRHGVGVDLSADYLRLAAWRCNDPALRAKVLGLDKPKAELPGQQSLL